MARHWSEAACSWVAAVRLSSLIATFLAHHTAELVLNCSHSETRREVVVHCRQYHRTARLCDERHAGDALTLAVGCEGGTGAHVQRTDTSRRRTLACRVALSTRLVSHPGRRSAGAECPYDWRLKWSQSPSVCRMPPELLGGRQLLPPPGVHAAGELMGVEALVA